MQCLWSHTTQDSSNDTPSFLLQTEKQRWQIVISYNLSLTRQNISPAFVLQIGSKNMFLSKYKEGEFDFLIAAPQFFVDHTYADE